MTQTGTTNITSADHRSGQYESDRYATNLIHRAGYVTIKATGEEVYLQHARITPEERKAMCAFTAAARALHADRKRTPAIAAAPAASYVAPCARCHTYCDGDCS